MIYCSATEINGRESIYEFMPLSGDPTAEEIKEYRKNRYKLRARVQEERVKRMIEKGIIKMPDKNK